MYVKFTSLWQIRASFKFKPRNTNIRLDKHYKLLWNLLLRWRWNPLPLC